MYGRLHASLHVCESVDHGLCKHELRICGCDDRLSEYRDGFSVMLVLLNKKSVSSMIRFPTKKMPSPCTSTHGLDHLVLRLQECDDGNSEEYDGCNAVCQKVGRICSHPVTYHKMSDMMSVCQKVVRICSHPVPGTLSSAMILRLLLLSALFL